MSSTPDIGLNSSELATFFTTYFAYYTTLDTNYKSVFVNRAQQFISEKEISGAGGFVPDNRVKAIIAASAVQLTLGLDTWQMDYFGEIIVHPSDFDSSSGKQKFSGETNLQGFMQFSWKNFIHGYQVEDDNLNLGLHEFTHALRFSAAKGNRQDYFVDYYFNKWLASANEAFYDIKNGRDTIFRKYGGANINEFLSVCVEHYFESPEEIKERYPHLYYATGILLNQYSDGKATKIGVRDEFFENANKLLPGLEKQVMETRFLKHWLSKVVISVGAIFFYQVTANDFRNGVSIALLITFIGVLCWYWYSALQMTWEKTSLQIEKGRFIFNRRKLSAVPLSKVISIKVDVDEWELIFYDSRDSFFHREQVSAPKGGREAFLSNCIRNKIAVLR